MEKVILVDENDNEVGLEEKLKAHKEGKLHRAFSIFVFNSKNELLLQQRAKEKYHCGGLWTNTCCSHPRSGESIEEAAHRRLIEEMGFDCDLKEIFSFIYAANLDNGFQEHEYDHVLIGRCDKFPNLNKEEAMDWKYIDTDELRRDMKENPNKYTYWSMRSIGKVISYL